MPSKSSSFVNPFFSCLYSFLLNKDLSWTKCDLTVIWLCSLSQTDRHQWHLFSFVLKSLWVRVSSASFLRFVCLLLVVRHVLLKWFLNSTCLALITPMYCLWNWSQLSKIMREIKLIQTWKFFIFPKQIPVKISLMYLLDILAQPLTQLKAQTVLHTSCLTTKMVGYMFVMVLQQLYRRPLFHFAVRQFLFSCVCC